MKKYRSLLIGCVYCIFLVVAPHLNSVADPLSGNDTRINDVMTALSKNPRDVAALNSYGIEQAKRNDLIGAVRTWRYALEFAPRYVHLYNNIGSALRRLGYPKESLDWYKASLKIQPTYWTWFNLGLLYEDLKNTREALVAHQQALNLCPSFAQAQEHHLRLTREAVMGNPKPPVAINLPLPKTPMKESPTPKTSDEIISRKILTHHNYKDMQQKPVVRNNEDIKTEKAELLTEKPEIELREQFALPSDGGGQVFLTFDGGADADGISGILSALKFHGVQSTFFLTGQWVKSYPDLAKQILAEGHEIANHSMKHPHMSSWTREQIASELEKTEAAFREVLGRRAAPFFRFPFGDENKRVEAIVEELGYRPVYWNIDTLDWKEPSIASIISKVRMRIKRGAVVLMHVGSKNGSKALPRILDDLSARGYQPGRLSSLDPAQIARLPLYR